MPARAWLVSFAIVCALPASAGAQFSGTVRDGAGPVAGAHVVVNHGARTTTDASGLFSVDAPRVGSRDLVSAALPGYFLASIDVLAGAPTTDLELALEPLSDDSTYVPMATVRCYGCHVSHREGWSGVGGFAASAHAHAAENPRVLDIFSGTASGRSDAARCAEVGGTLADVQGPDGVSVSRCYVGVGLLPDMNPQCGHDGQPRCDDYTAAPDERPSDHGDCAGCHTPGLAIALPAEVDLRAAELDPEHGGVTCEVCHRIREVLDPNLPGVLRGARIWRANDPADNPMALGPLDDAVYAFMRTSYSPLHTTSLVCAPCHQDTYSADGMAPRWVNGVPSEQTFEEWSESPYANGARETTCQGCHMRSLRDLAVTPDRSVLALGGPDRDPALIHAHGFDPLTDPASLDDAIDVALEAHIDGAEIVARASVANRGVGHGFPSGVTSRNAILLVEARAPDGDPLVVTGGEIVPQYGGAYALGTVVAQDGRTLTLDADVPAGSIGRELRVWEDTSEHRTYVGFGVLRDASDEEKGLVAHRARGRFHIRGVRGRDVELEGVVPEDLIGMSFAIGDARYLAGTSGFGFAKVNVAGDGTPDVPFWRAVDILWDNRIAPDETQSSEHRFALPASMPGRFVVSARLVYRDTFPGLADERGWMLEELDAGEAMAEIVIDGPDAGGVDAGAPDGGTMTTPSGCSCRAAPTSGRAPWGMVVFAIIAIARSRARR